MAVKERGVGPGDVGNTGSRDAEVGGRANIVEGDVSGVLYARGASKESHGFFICVTPTMVNI